MRTLTPTVLLATLLSLSCSPVRHLPVQSELLVSDPAKVKWLAIGGGDGVWEVSTSTSARLDGMEDPRTGETVVLQHGDLVKLSHWNGQWSALYLSAEAVTIKKAK